MKTHGRLLCPVEIRWVTAHIAGEGRSQLLLLPDSIDDYVGSEDPVRFIDPFVDGLVLAGAGFRHGCSLHFRTPKTNFTGWVEKLGASAARLCDILR